MKNNVINKISSCLAVALMISMLSVGVAHSTNAPSSVTLSISPATQAIAAGQTVSFSVMATNNLPTYAMQFSVNYDPGLFTLNSVVAGNGTSSWTMEQNSTQAGVLKLGFYNTSPLDLVSGALQVAYITLTVNSVLPASYNPKIEIVPTVNSDQTIPVMFGIDGLNEAELGSTQISNGAVSLSSPNNAPTIDSSNVPSSVTLPSTLQIAATVSDKDNNTLTSSWSKVSGPGTVTFGNSTSLITTASFGSEGAYVIRLSVSDGIAAAVTRDFNVTVNPVPNHAPTIDSSSVSASVTLPSALSLSAAVSDLDGDSLTTTWSKVSGSGSVTFGDAAALSTSASFGAAGSYVIRLSVSDGIATAVTKDFAVTVNAKPNSIPVASAQTVTTSEDTAKAITLAGTDPDGDNLSYMIVNAPAHGALSGTAPNLTYTPIANYNGNDSFSFKVNDGTADSAAAIVSLNITAVNDLPTVSGQSFSIQQDTSKDLTVTASDIDGDALTYTIVNGPSHGSLSGTGPNYTYTPVNGYRGSDSFSFKAHDSKVDSPVATVNITLTAVNHAPSATAISISTPEDTAKAITLAGTDPDGDNLSYMIVNAPAHGVLSGTAPNLTYTPSLNYNGADSFSFKVNDGSVDSAAVSVSLNITAVNDLPVANALVVATSEDVAKTITLTGSDVDGDNLSYVIVNNPSHGSLSGSAPNITYTPAGNYHGSDSFTFKVNDGTADSSTATVSVNVSHVNHAPSATAINVSTAEDSAKAITLVGSDPDGDALSYMIVNSPAHGTLTGTAPNLTYTPATNYNGSDTFTFKANDGTVDSPEATVSVNITAVNDAPVANALTFTTSEDVAKNIVLTASDVDADNLTYTIVNAPSHGSLSGTAPNLTYTPASSYYGNDSFSFKVNDGAVDSAPAVVNLNVTHVNHAPVAIAQNVVADEDASKAVILAGSDIDGDSLKYSIVSSPSHGSLTGTAPNLTYTPTAYYHGSDSFSFKVNDGALDSATATVSLTVNHVNHAPSATSANITASEDALKAITLSGTDPDGDTISYSIVSGPSHGALSGTAPNLIYTPVANYNGSDSFSFQVNDGTVSSSVAAVNVNVTATNDAPVANTQSVTALEDVAKAVVLTGSDIDGDNLSYIIVHAPDHGTLSGTAPNLTYTPALNYNGDDAFTFKVNDGKADSAVATVNLNVVAMNDAPMAKSQNISVLEDGSKAITLIGTDVEGDALTYKVVTQPAHGSLSGTAPNLTYIPQAGYFGSDSFAFKVNDGLADSEAGTVYLSISHVNHAPIADDQSVVTSEDSSKSITLSGSDSDSEDTLSYVLLDKPLHGNIIGRGQTLTYRPADNYFGNDSFTFKVSDGKADSAPATVSITVTPVNDMPIADFSMDKVKGSIPLIVKFNAEDSADLEGPIVSYRWDFGDDSPQETGINVSHSYNALGEYKVTLTVMDAQGAMTSATKTVKVVNLPPIADIKSDISEGTVPVNVSFKGDGSKDEDGKIVSYSWDFGDGTSSSEVNPAHTFTTANAYTVNLTVTDDKGDKHIVSKNIKVNPVVNVRRVRYF